MMNIGQSKNKDGKRSSWDRYVDLMIVGDHGQVIPFQRFKKLAFAVISGLVVCLILVVVLGGLLIGSFAKNRAVKSSLEETRKQLAQLRDEKDLLLTQMVIKKKHINTNQPVDSPKIQPKPAGQESQTATVAAPAPPAQIVSPPKKEVPAEPPEKKKVQLSAEARRISVNYQTGRELLSLSFRVYNTSQPKVPLSGRTVVVFKNIDDPPIKWLAVPRVQLVEGKPSGKRGKAFKINNYRTEKFKAYHLKPPIRYNMATIFVYSSSGELLFTKDHSFKIDAKPVAKPIIPKPAPAPVQKKPEPPVETVKPAAPTPPSQPVTPEATTDPAATNPGSPQSGLNDSATTQTENRSSDSASPQSEVQPPAPPTAEPAPAEEKPVQPESPTETEAPQTHSELNSPTTTQGEQQ